MTARTDVNSIAGGLVYISADLPVTYDAAGYADTGMDWTVINKIESIGNHGMKAKVNAFTPIDTGVTTKSKGTKDYGSLTLSCGSIPTDAGQILLKTAADAAQTHYSVKLRYPDGAIHYLDVIVTSYEYQDGSVDNTSKISVEMPLTRAHVEVAA